MSSNPDYYEDEEDNVNNDEDMDDYAEVMLCGSCNREFEVGFGEEPERCPLCGEVFDF